MTVGPLPSPGLPPGHTVSQDSGAEAPPVVLYFRMYAGFVTLVNLGLAALGLALAFMPMLVGKAPKPGELIGSAVIGGIYMTIGIALGTAHLIATVMPRKPWAHTYGLVILAMAFVFNTGCCLVALPLLIYWSKEDVKRWFARGDDALTYDGQGA